MTQYGLSLAGADCAGAGFFPLFVGSCACACACACATAGDAFFTTGACAFASVLERGAVLEAVDATLAMLAAGIAGGAATTGGGSIGSRHGLGVAVAARASAARCSPRSLSGPRYR